MAAVALDWTDPRRPDGLLDTEVSTHLAPMPDTPGRLVAALADRYRIERELGAGGMATVYAAHDVRHERTVALKVLRPEIAAMLGSARFLREIRVAAGLNHPRILPLFDSGDAAGTLFYAMPLVSGGSLRTRLDREGQLGVADAVALVHDIAAALDYAHAQGVVHRDIKPENILYHHGEPMLADFGIALAVTESAGERLTGTGLSVGTPQYMSPEQVGGDQHIDGRSDVYSLGCVLYEALAGEPPFTGRTPMAVMARQVTDPLPPITTVRPDLPDPIVRALSRALTKVPADRFASAGAFASALVEAGRAVEAEPAAAAPPRRVVAVLPFANLSADAENEYFSDGMTDDVIMQLSKVRELKVISRTSSVRFKDSRLSLREVGDQLGADVILEGSVRRAADRVRIVVQLIDARADDHLWSESYDRELTDVFAIQSDVAIKIAGALQAHLSPAERSRIEEKPTDDLGAWDLYLLGRHHWNRRTDEGIRAAISHFRRAIEMDPGYARAWAGLADAYLFAGMGYAAMPTKESLPEARRAALKAVELDPSLAEAHSTLGFAYLICDFDPDTSVAELNRALALDPDHADAHQWLAWCNAYRGDYLGALRSWRRALELNPLSVVLVTESGWPWVYAGLHDRALEHYDRALEIDREFALTHYNIGWALHCLGRYDEAIAKYRTSVELSGGAPFMQAFLGTAYTEIGRTDEARGVLDDLLERARHAHGISLSVAVAAEALGETELALEWLERAFDERDPFLVGLLTPEWFRLASLRADPRFQAMLARFPVAPHDVARERERLLDYEARQHPAAARAKSDPYSLPPARQAAPASRPFRPTAHTVGRDVPLGELDDVLGQVSDGRGQMVVVAGEAGIGKTTVIESFLLRVRAGDRAVRIARGQCSERLAGSAAYLPILEALEDLVAVDANGELAVLLADTAPRWRAELDAEGDERESAAPVSPERLKLEFARFLEQVSRAGPVVLCIEDIHWADLSTVDLLAYLADRFERIRLMLLVSARPEDLRIGGHPFVDLQLDLQARGVCRRLDLPLLGAEDIRLYLDLEFPAHRLPASFASLIHESTEGSPLFMADLVRHFREQGLVRRRSGSWELVGPVADLKDRLPRSVRSMIERKLGRLSDGDRRLLAAASVHGYEFDSLIVSAVLDLDPADVEERLGQLASVHALVAPVGEHELPDGALTARYRFVHVLYQNALFDGLAPSRRTAWCRTVARLLREHHADALDAIASQLAQFHELGREFHEAAGMYLTAARSTARISAYHETVRLADHGLDQLDRLAPGASRDRLELDLQAARGPALMLSQGYAAADVLACYGRARDLAAGLADDRAAVAALIGLFLHSAIGGDLLRALGLAREALHLAERNGSPELILPARQLLFSAQLWHGDFEDALDNAERTFAEYDPSLHAKIAQIIPQDSGQASLVFAGYAHWYLGHLDRHRDRVGRGIAHAEALGHIGSLAEALSFECGLAMEERDAARARDAGTRLLDLAEEHGLPDRIRFARFTLAAADVLEGDPAQGIDAVRTANDAIAGQWTLLLPVYRSFEADTLLWAGQYETGLEVVRAAMEAVERTGEHGRDADMQRIQGDLLAAIASRDGDPGGETTTEAFASYARALEIARAQKARIFELRAATGMARLARGTEMEPAAMQQLEDVYGWFTAGHGHADLVAAAEVLATMNADADAGP